MSLPNIKLLFQPDPGYIICDIDLDRADLQVVIAEADDAELRQACAEGIDLHALNAATLANVPLHSVTSRQRAFAKAWVHGTNYGGAARTMAIAAGCTVAESEHAQDRWFGAHPGIKAWHERTESSLQTTRQIRNAFGFRRFYFGRMNGLLPQALAWVPQSTVAYVINKGLRNVYDQIPQIQLLMQVHDSLVVQIPAGNFVASLLPLQAALSIPIPYSPVLTIGTGIKASRHSWGACAPIDWNYKGVLAA